MPRTIGLLRRTCPRRSAMSAGTPRPCMRGSVAPPAWRSSQSSWQRVVDAVWSLRTRRRMAAAVWSLRCRDAVVQRSASPSGSGRRPRGRRRRPGCQRQKTMLGISISYFLFCCCFSTEAVPNIRRTVSRRLAAKNSAFAARACWKAPETPRVDTAPEDASRQP